MRRLHPRQSKGEGRRLGGYLGPRLLLPFVRVGSLSAIGALHLLNQRLLQTGREYHLHGHAATRKEETKRRLAHIDSIVERRGFA